MTRRDCNWRIQVFSTKIGVNTFFNSSRRKSATDEIALSGVRVRARLSLLDTIDTARLQYFALFACKIFEKAYLFFLVFSKPLFHLHVIYISPCFVSLKLMPVMPVGLWRPVIIKRRLGRCRSLFLDLQSSSSYPTNHPGLVPKSVFNSSNIIAGFTGAWCTLHLSTWRPIKNTCDIKTSLSSMLRFDAFRSVHIKSASFFASEAWLLTYST